MGFSATLICLEYEALARREGRDHVDRGFGAFLPASASQRRAINGDHIGRHSGLCSEPGDEAALEFLGLERRENVAEVIMLGLPSRNGRTQMPELPGIEHLCERIKHLAGLMRIGQIPQMI